MNRRLPRSIDELFLDEQDVLLATLLGTRWRMAPDAARDVLADTYAQCRRIEARVMAANDPARFMTAVMANCARRYWDRQGTPRWLDLSDDDAELERIETQCAAMATPQTWRAATPDEARHWREVQALLVEGLAVLRQKNPLYADVLVSRGWSDGSFEEIAQELGLASSAAARGLWARAAARLQQWWRDRTGDDEPPYLYGLLALPGGMGSLMPRPRTTAPLARASLFRPTRPVFLGGAAVVVGSLAAWWHLESRPAPPPVAVAALALPAAPPSAVSSGPAQAPASDSGLSQQDLADTHDARLMLPPVPGRPAAPAVHLPETASGSDGLELPGEPVAIAVSTLAPESAEPESPADRPTPLATDLEAYRRARALLEDARRRPARLPDAVVEYDRLLATKLQRPVEQLARLDRAELAVRAEAPDARDRLLEILASSSDPALWGAANEMLAVTLARQDDCAALRQVPDGSGGTTSAPDELLRRCRRSARRSP